MDDIHNRLEREFGLLRSMVTVSWEEGKDAERLKELQTKKAFVKVIGEGKEVAPVDIEVVRLEEGEHATS